MHNLTLLGLLAVPLIGSIAIFALPTGKNLLAKQIALFASVITFLYAIVLGVDFKTSAGASRFQFNASWVWIKNLGVHFAFGVDGIALVLIAMATLLVPCVVLSSWNTFDSVTDAEELETTTRSPKTYFGLILLLEVFMIGVFAATDVFLFYVFFEAMLVPMYFIIGSFGGPRRQYAAMKFFLYSLFGGLLMLASVIGVYVSSGTSSFAFTDLVGHVPTGATQKWLFLGFFIAFAIKAPLFPFHTWLPDAGAEAPAGGAALLVGVLDKVGTFGFLRYCLPLFPEASRYFAQPILILSVIGVLYAAFLAMGQRDMKRLVAYTSVAHFGFIGLGIFAFTTQGGTGAVLYMLNHGLATGLLFIVVGYVVARGKSRQITDYSGTAKVTPRLGGTFLIAGLAALALPGMSTFISEFLTLLGTFTRHKALAIIATTGIILAALYVLLLYQRTMQGVVSEKVAAFRDLNAREIFAVAPLIVLIFALGIYPKPVIDIINPAVKFTMQDVGKTDPQPQNAAQLGGQK
ncbi:NADH-quinone oxidoreductase subunit M [Jatrophihabitans lederbergiae]|uniref:NADH-quinone oxidoreductase subunit M n=1 Tax=Jatrophihabitans lederbergiae TaxID=3075547 RepID=A0ABU2J560_9ACTN|nr:NADH-quinone oxidoreductase subunit M [Jatrophihabitans sp. DSM 44399]MDT0260117.1 NADH-quinone oxidoreductase subunit M [Jatrophihabitans sp. DSM 44399]